MGLEEDIELIGMPQSGFFILVQIMLDNKPIMVCNANGLHGIILASFLRSRDVPFDKFISYGTEIPRSIGTRYRVVGAGNSGIYPQNNTFFLPRGDSTGYGIGPNEDFEERLRSQFKDWILV